MIAYRGLCRAGRNSAGRIERGIVYVPRVELVECGAAFAQPPVGQPVFSFARVYGGRRFRLRKLRCNQNMSVNCRYTSVYLLFPSE